jgi:hypothetical protein
MRISTEPGDRKNQKFEAQAPMLRWREVRRTVGLIPMAWWHRLFLGNKAPSGRPEYRVAFRLYSQDGKREIEVRERRDGRAYFVEREWVEGTTFKDRGSGEEIGPYQSPEAAEAAAIARPWFSGGGNQK